MENLQSYNDSDKHDKEDIRAADRELVDEIAAFDKWRKRASNPEFSQPGIVWPEWKEIVNYWGEPAPPATVTDVFDQFVHDSRAWFKPFGDDIPDLQFKLEQLVAREEAVIEWEHNPVGERPQPLSAWEKAQLTQYKPYRGTPNVREGITPSSHGREYAGVMGGGFLRYRKIYMGSDAFKPKGAVYASLAPSQPRIVRLNTDQKVPA
jgi:hypothetical protein